ncbi:MAG TPA: ferric reductase-like transmembrane domain-containing protein [Polyangiaceae bacterium]
MAKSTKSPDPQAEPEPGLRPSGPAPRAADRPPLHSGVAPAGGFDDAFCAPEASSALRPPHAPKGFSIAPASRSPLSEEQPGPPPTKRRVHPLDAALVKLLEKSFTKHAGQDRLLDAGELRDALGLGDVFLAKRLLRVLADSATSQGSKQASPTVTRAEFVERVALLVSGDIENKLRFAFCIHDLDGDGYIQREELLRMMTACLAEEVGDDAGAGKRSTPAALEALRSDQSADAEKLTSVLLRAVDHDADARLSYAEFSAEVCKHSGLFELITRSEARWIVPQPELLNPFRERRTWGQRLRRQLENRVGASVGLGLWALANGVLFASAMMAYSASGGWIMLARGCGACLNFNGALILIPVMRRLLTRIRQLHALRALPVDDALTFHRIVGHTMFGLALVHSGAHLANYHSQGAAWLEQLGRVPAAQTGLALLFVYALMWGFSFLRRSRNFELFYFTHWLYVAWFALLLWHGPVFYLWATVPLIGFAIDWALRQKSSAEPTELVELEPLPSEVTRVGLARPPGFTHQAGDYAFLRIPALAKHEWHPFTISSAPERQLLTMHVRSAGNFTSALRALAEQRLRDGAPQPVKAYLDGPYGAPSSHIFAATNAVLIGAGIGVTPFASVLESLVLRAQDGRERPKKVHFFWLNRDPHSFEWFHDLLTRIEQTDQGRLVDIRIFMTSGRGHITATFLNLARELLHQQGDPDLLTGLRSKTNMGRPDWHQELSEIAEQHRPEPVEVFFCGPPGLGRQIHAACRDLQLGFRQEDF